MRYLSLFSGIEAASVAWEPLGWECAAVSEIEPFPCAVLAHHYPGVPNLGDVTKIDAADIAALGRIDLVVFGSPCQDLSVAGKREGLAGARSGLFHTAVQIVRWAREYGGCRWALWENVPGAFSSNKGRDFAVVVGELAGLADVPVPPKGWGTEGAALGEEALVEWATLDAQWFGVAQRRRRVFALADFGDWAGRSPVLLEPESLRGDSPPSRAKGQGLAADAGNRPAGSGRKTSTGPVSHCLNAGGMGRIDYESETLVVEPTLFSIMPMNSGKDYKARPVEVAQPLMAGGPTTGAQGGDMVVEPYTLEVRGRPGENGLEPSLEWRQDGVTNAVRASEGGRGGLGVGAVAFHWNAQPDQMNFSNESTASLTCSQQAAVAMCATGDITHTLKAEGFDGSEDGTGRGIPTVAQAMQVRRLTPKECCRLQGFPDDYLDITFRNKPAADGPKYKALGNSFAVPVVRWIGVRLATCDLV